MSVLLAIEPGPTTSWTVTVDGETATGILEPIDVGAWVDRLIRSAHRTEHRIRVIVIKPKTDDLMTVVATNTLRRVFGIYDQVKVDWRT